MIYSINFIIIIYNCVMNVFKYWWQPFTQIFIIKDMIFLTYKTHNCTKKMLKKLKYELKNENIFIFNG